MDDAFLLRFTRNELTDFELLTRGPGAVFEGAEKCMHTLAAARLADLVQSHGAEGGKEVFRCFTRFFSLFGITCAALLFCLFSFLDILKFLLFSF